MPDRVSRGELESILSRVDSTLPARQHLAELVLMLALADTFTTDDELERVIRTIGTYGELEGLDVAWLRDRAEVLREHAPLFSEARAQISRELTDPRAARLGLTLAAKLVSASRELQEEERALFHSLADAFRIPEAERPRLLAPWVQPSGFQPESLTFAHCPFNDPDRTERLSFFDAMRTTDSDAEFRMLVQKVILARAFISKQLEVADISAVGEAVRVGPYELRVDALVEAASPADTIPGFQHYVLRCLSAGEALHPLEHAAIATLSLRLDESSRFVVVHGGELSPTDKVFLQGFDQALVRAVQIGA